MSEQLHRFLRSGVVTAVFSRFAMPAVAVFAAFSGAGCVVINVGEPEVFVHEEFSGEASVPVPGTEQRIVAVSAVVEQRDQPASSDFVHVKLNATQRGTFDIRRTTTKYTVRRQRRLAVGFYPGAAEYYLMPEGALVPCNSDGIGNDTYENDPRVKGFGFGMGALCAWYLFPIGVVETVNSLLIAPFCGWDCTHDLVPAQGVFGSKYIGWHVELTPEIQALSKFSDSERAKMGVQSILGRYHGGSARGWSFGHQGLVGVHKHLAVFVEKPTTATETVRKTREETFNAFGPCYVELSVPALNHVQRKRLSGSVETSFRIPGVDRDCTVTAFVSFQADPDNPPSSDSLHHEVLDKAKGRKWSGVLHLKASPNATLSLRPQSVGVVTNVVVVAPRPRTPQYRLRDEEPFADGRAVYRLEILDETPVLELVPKVRPEVEGNVRREFLAANPDADESLIRVVSLERYEGTIVRFEVRVYALPPEVEPVGYEYSQETRRGTMRFRVSERARANMAKVKAWARENIAAVVTDKNVLLTAGQRPPDGATYRSLDENFSDGVLTVEFEALE